MSARKWRSIVVEFDDGKYVSIGRADFDKIEAVAEVLEALHDARKMQWELDRLLGKAEDP